MVKLRFTSHTLFIVILLSAFSLTALARDISNEQRNAYEARKEFNKKKSNHQNLLSRVSQQEKKVAEEQERLQTLRAEEATAKQALDQAKTNLDDKVEALNAVWDQRDR